MAHHTAKLELLIDGQNEEKQYACQRKTTGIPQVAQGPHEGQWQDDYNTDNDDEEVSLQEPAPLRIHVQEGTDNQGEFGFDDEQVTRHGPNIVQTDLRSHYYLPSRPQHPLSQLLIGSDAYNTSTGQQDMDGI